MAAAVLVAAAAETVALLTMADMVATMIPPKTAKYFYKIIKEGKNMIAMTTVVPLMPDFRSNASTTH